MTDKVKLSGRCQPCGPTSNNGNFLPGTRYLSLGLHISFVKRNFNDVLFNLLDCDCGLINSKDTSSFTGCRTNAAGKFREVICRGKNVICFSPTLSINGVIEFRDDITQGAPIMTKRNSTVHAPG